MKTTGKSEKRKQHFKKHHYLGKIIAMVFINYPLTLQLWIYNPKDMVFFILYRYNSAKYSILWSVLVP